ncbi:MAG TPA: DinB family protein [Longimicrobiaceae bacterium]|nr:DinB family protein [Longimicrobiaceae bacterium]
MPAPAPAPADDPKWQRAVREHQDAIARCVAEAEAVPEEAWARPRARGKWSPGQVADHLARSYAAILGELRGGEGVRPRVPAWQQRVFRWTVLPHMLFHRSFPLRASAPREIRPAADTPDRAEVLGRLRALAAETERGMEAALGSGATISHPYFGPLPLRTALRFCAVHVEHHTRQLRA